MPNLINNLEEKNINIPLKGEKIISTKNFYNLSFYFYDYITVDKTKNYLIVYIFDQLHVYKIYQIYETLNILKLTGRIIAELFYFLVF